MITTYGLREPLDDLWEAAKGTYPEELAGKRKEDLAYAGDVIEFTFRSGETLAFAASVLAESSREK